MNLALNLIEIAVLIRQLGEEAGFGLMQPPLQLGHVLLQLTHRLQCLLQSPQSGVGRLQQRRPSLPDLVDAEFDVALANFAARLLQALA